MKPDLTVAQILAWADVFHTVHRRWPTRRSGPVGHTGNTWLGLDTALKLGHRGLPPGSSLSKLLLEHRGRRHQGLLPDLTPAQILVWADAFRARTGDWPGQDSGRAAPGETWSGIDTALAKGGRGLPGGSSLAQLLAAERGVRNRLDLPPLSPEQILGWADAHRARTGGWPNRNSGPVIDAPGETWANLGKCLHHGWRGLPRGSSVARLLAAHRGVRNPADKPRLTEAGVLRWADAHRARMGRWPTAGAGVIADSPDDTWGAVEAALWKGARGLPGRDSLARLLTRRRGKRNPRHLPPLTLVRVRRWMLAHRRRTGRWPTSTSGPIPESNGETWLGVDRALRRGRRGLPGGHTLATLARERSSAPGGAGST